MVRVLLPVFAAIGVATAVVQLTTTGCSDASGLETCLNAVTASTSKCLNHADADASQLETVACGCANYILSYNCYASHCWNRVNECEYQSYIIEYLINLPIAKTPVPYFPTPKGAPDACSCNLGDVYEAIIGSISQSTTCVNNQNGGDALTNVQRIQGCECCEVSAALSSIYGICPTTDPTLIGLNQVQSLQTNLNTPIDSCAPYIAQYPCESDLGFSAVAGGTFYDAANLPASGTATLSNGPGTVTVPASGSVFTYTNPADSQVYVISAAGVKAGAGDSGSGNVAATTTGSSGSGSSGGSGGSGGGSATGGAASPVKTGLAGQVSVGWGLLSVAVLVNCLIV
ncbi:hypothetical protein VF21_04920 [Pseudogymnoascus sp. 05NY08]|nr:hypothetical protein VF21_04920 [Pseudogymnoascus sp. 05NY08]